MILTVLILYFIGLTVQTITVYKQITQTQEPSKTNHLEQKDLRSGKPQLGSSECGQNPACKYETIKISQARSQPIYSGKPGFTG